MTDTLKQNQKTQQFRSHSCREVRVGAEFAVAGTPSGGEPALKMDQVPTRPTAPILLPAGPMGAFDFATCAQGRGELLQGSKVLGWRGPEQCTALLSGLRHSEARFPRLQCRGVEDGLHDPQCPCREASGASLVFRALPSHSSPFLSAERRGRICLAAPEASGG